MWRKTGGANIIPSKRRCAMWDKNMCSSNSGNRWQIIAALFLFVSCARAQAPATTQSIYETCKPSEDGIGKVYMGREIAQVMGHLAADWLERPEREKEEEPAKLMTAMKLKPGMAVADLGAGSGYFTFRVSELVGDKGKVYAVD